MIVDILLYIVAAMLVAYLILNVVVYILVRVYVMRSLRKLKEILEDLE